MARFSGRIGFSLPTEVDPVNAPGILESVITERPYRGDFVRKRVRVDMADSMSGNLALSDNVSIVADSFAKNNLGYMCYVTLYGQKWCITEADISTYPRIVLTIGGLWNEQTN